MNATGDEHLERRGDYTAMTPSEVALDWHSVYSRKAGALHTPVGKSKLPLTIAVPDKSYSYPGTEIPTSAGGGPANGLPVSEGPADETSSTTVLSTEGALDLALPPEPGNSAD